MDAFVRGDLTLVLSELTLRELEPAPQAVRDVLAEIPSRRGIRVHRLRARITACWVSPPRGVRLRRAQHTPHAHAAHHEQR